MHQLESGLESVRMNKEIRQHYGRKIASYAKQIED